jgi:hypothetical protein
VHCLIALLAFSLLVPAVALADDPPVAVPASADGQPPAAEASGRAVIIAAKELLPCSRYRPQEVTGFWQPDPGLVAKVDAELQRVLRRDPGARRSLLQFHQYHRQHVGFLRGKQRMIYVNAFPVAVAPDLPDWQNNLVVACDGGARFWGIEYNVAKSRFSHFSVNRDAAAARKAGPATDSRTDP